MTKSIKTSAKLIVSIVFCLCALFLSYTSVFTASDYGLNATAGAAALDTKRDVPTIVGNVLGAALSMIGVLFFALMVYGGLLWMTARGNEETTKKAMNTILAAIIGLVIIFAAYAITTFVFKSVGGTPPVTTPAVP